jgi:hypothetical protein
MSVNNDYCQMRMNDIELARGRSDQRNQQLGEAMHQMAMMGMELLQQLLQGLTQILGPILAMASMSG